jgi:glucosylceramidase
MITSSPIKKTNRSPMKKYIICAVGIALAACSAKKNTTGTAPHTAVGSDVSFWLTTGDRSALLEKQNTALIFGNVKNSNPTITVDESQKYQRIDGFGYTLTGGSAGLINALPASDQDSLLQNLFSTAKDGIGVSYIRLSIGASDMSADTFTYNDLPAGQTDAEQSKFSLSKDMGALIPVLKKIIAIQPGIKILGSPWSPPTWMKTNNSFKGGSLKPEYYQSYAKYFVKYIQAMKAQGIMIDAVTIQNEPLHPGNVPSMYMEAKDQAIFIKSALGPLFKSSGIKTKIILYDHNADRPDYPVSILNDAGAKPYVDGSAFHLYAGKVTALSTVHDAHPDKNVYFTEQWVGGPGKFDEDLKWHVSTLIIGATRNWSRNVLEWNLAADPSYGPHTVGGCITCLGAITVAPAVTKNVAYYVIGHASKFVSPGSVRIASNISDDLQNVAFKTPQGKTVLIVANVSRSEQAFNIQSKAKAVTAVLPGGAVGTFVW